MAERQYRNRGFSFGLNSSDAEHATADQYGTVDLNVVVGEGFVETRNGLTLFNQDLTKSGGITMMCPAYFRDGSKRLVFANDDDYYYLDNTATSSTAWTLIGDYGTAINNPFATVYQNTVAFGTGYENSSFKWSGKAGDYAPAFLTGDTGAQSTAATWAAVTDGSFRITINGVAYNVDGINFTGVATMTNVASTIQAAIRALTLSTETVVWTNATHFVISSSDTTVTSAITVTSTSGGTVGTDISGAGASDWMDADTGNGVVTSKSQNFSTVATPADASNDIRFFEYHQGSNIAYLLGGGDTRDDATKNNSTLFYTTNVDNWSSGGVISIGTNDGQSLTAVKSHGNILAYKDNSMYRLDVVYESNSGTNILRVLERFQDIGSVNHEVCQVALNDILSLSQRHGVRGSGQVQTKLGGSGSRRMSTKIKPLLDLINWSVAKSRARAIVWENKYFLAVPMNGSPTNNAVFVGHLDLVTDIGEIPWTLFSMNVGSFAIFQDSTGVERLMIGDSNSPKIYVYDPDSLTDNGANIISEFRTKKIDMGDMEIDTSKFVVLAGQMSEPTEIKATVSVDGVEEIFVIKKEQIINNNSLIWSHVIGSEIIGGNSSGAARPRWLAVLCLPDSQRNGAEFQIDVFSIGKGFYWRLDYLSINENLNYNLFAENHFVSAQS